VGRLKPTRSAKPEGLKARAGFGEGQLVSFPPVREFGGVL